MVPEKIFAMAVLGMATYLTLPGLLHGEKNFKLDYENLELGYYDSLASKNIKSRQKTLINAWAC